MTSINVLLAQALRGNATLLDLEAIPPATIASLPDDKLLAYSAIMSDLTENDTADWQRILRKANGHAEPLRETFIELLDKAPAEAPLILDPTAPLDCARSYLDRRHTQDGALILVHYRQEFFEWVGTHHRVVPDGEVRCDLWGFLDGASRRVKIEKEWSVIPFKPNKVRIGDVFDALRAAANVPAHIEPPAFLDDPDRDAGNYLALKNGILNVYTRELIPHTPRFFNLGAAGYDYDPKATTPTWEKFLDDLFDDDLESRETLEEIIGLFLIPETKYQKLFLIVGPKRGGKGTIGRLVKELLGPLRVATPTIKSLGEPFGLQQLLGATVAVVGDARLKADAEEVAERLLGISGEDGLDVPRKFLPSWHGRLGIRFLLLSNELPILNDPSGALSSRFIVIQLTESFLGREDPDLDERLKAERPGILNRCLEGLHRLQERGRFIQPVKGAAAIDALEALASPHRVFLDEMCEEGPMFEVECEALYLTWRKWCENNGREHKGTKQRFARDLRTVCPTLPKPVRRGTGRVRVYPGLGLK